jgi:predicted permease
VPGFTAIAVAIIALCLGANLTVFAVIDSVLLRPLPFPEASRLVTIFNTYPRAGVDRDGASYTNYYERRGQIAAFRSLAIVRPDTAIVGDPGATERVETSRVSPEFFSTLGVPPIIGRSFTDDEMTYQTDGVVILTDAYWRQHFNADPAILHRTLRIDGYDRKIVGVLPPSFRFLSSRAGLYVPLSSNVERRTPADRHSGNSIMMIARLAPGATLADAQSQIDAHNASVASSYPRAQMIAEAGFRSVVVSLHADHVKSIRPVLLLLQTGVLFLLLIGAVNLINLLLIRASSRSRELAIRQSMGASRLHVIRSVLAETMVLAVLGGVAGLIVAAFGIDLVLWLGADQLPLGAQIAFDRRLATVAVVASIGFGAAIALPIAWFNLRAHLASALQSSSRSSTSNRAAQRLRHTFIVAQIALAFVLLSGAGLLGLSLRRAMAVSPGFRPDQVISGQFNLPWKNYHESSALLTFTERLTAEISRLPGVTAVGLATRLPLSGFSGKSAATVKGYVPPAGESVRAHYTYGVTGDYFAALGIPLRQGRFLSSNDSRQTDRSCVVDEAFAQRYWAKGDALGQKLFPGSTPRSDAEAFTVVGVVGSVKQAELTETETLGTVYYPLGHFSELQLFVVARTRETSAFLGSTLQTVVRGLDPELPLNDVRPMDTRIADTLVARRSPALLAGIFAAVALLLAAVGTYGVLSYAVSQRQREIGVRLALGAQAAQISRQFLSLGAKLLALGTLLGLVGAWLAGRAMQTVLFEVPALHLATLAVTAATMGVISFVACWWPARRATRVDPMIALRSE